jgi:hypothetical protein
MIGHRPMENVMKAMRLSILVALGVTACAGGRVNDTEQLARYMARAGEPVRQINYVNVHGWERVDDQHVILNMRRNQRWLLTLSGPCLSWDRGSPILKVATLNTMTLSTFDKVYTPDSRMSCLIQEIRPLDATAD